MLTRQSLWVPAVEYTPLFLKRYYPFTTHSPHSEYTIKAFHYKPENTKVLLQSSTKQKDIKIPIAMAFPLIITPEACEGVLNNNNNNNNESNSKTKITYSNNSTMSIGTFISLVDCTTSLHVMEWLHPLKSHHVSVSLQANLVNSIFVGENVVLISRINKIGNRLGFVSAKLLQDKTEVNALMQEEEEKAKTIEEIDQLLQKYVVLANAWHVKCMLPYSSNDK